MKRTIAFFILGFCFLQGAVTAYSMERGTPEYEKMKEYKKTQHDKKAAGPAEKGFWQREGERSGLTGSAMALGKIAMSAVPLEKPNANK